MQEATGNVLIGGLIIAVKISVAVSCRQSAATRSGNLMGLIRANHSKEWDAKPQPKSGVTGYGRWVAGQHT